ncbi:hypothetical protein GWK48_01465 [Metallosphaera tengchongensis]|uniref:Phosphate-starvation-inducible PsiE family protein n=1 Tax=Metallosphaera tengchongensis TaxID=1532350 RepID=A0A6N0NVS4_9CREN|nr:phosphate-starvation-inducible PsiE family protein [Metallosphaera tengchongensis]QKQ99240.1 hypothetical protein GWK48_01465 [Metallosphaera tengchongensis]
MKFISSSIIFKIVSIIVQILLLLGLGFTILSTIIQMISSLQGGLFLIASIILENVLLIIVFLEVYLSALDFFRGKGRSVIYVIDAMISFVSREIIIEILTSSVNPLNLLTLGGLIIAGASARYILSSRKRKPVRFRKNKKI